jgi:hypothetical protein
VGPGYWITGNRTNQEQKTSPVEPPRGPYDAVIAGEAAHPAVADRNLPMGILQAGDTEPLDRRGVPRLLLKADVNPLGFCFGRGLLFGSCRHGTFSLNRRRIVRYLA